jgi:FtsP/CotA-like multicopper oxidase with cupredoxin domain
MTTKPASRREFLALLKSLLATMPILGSGAFAHDHVSSKGIRTNKDALLGEAAGSEPPFTLVAKFATYQLDLEYGVDANGKLDHSSDVMAAGKFRFLCRTWAKDGVLDENFLGPLLELRPGQPLSIKVINALKGEGEYENIGPAEEKPENWLPVISKTKGPSVFLNKVDPLGFAIDGVCTPSTPIDKFAVDWASMPKNYNWTNLHLHGLQITPHLFEPLGTLEPTAHHIVIKPGEEKIYNFKIAEDQPPGTYWYHPHHHNSVAVQAWSGMAGMVIVRGKYDDELKSFGVTREIPFAVHDPHYTVDKAPTRSVPGVARVARFLASQNGEDDYTFMVMGRYRPEYVVKRNEIVLLRHLTATIENVSGFRVVRRTSSGTPQAPSSDRDNLPFWIIASDGICYGEPVKRTVMVSGGGERHDILLQLPRSGIYEIWSDHCGTIQFFGGGPKDQLLATLRVTEETARGQTPISEMAFTPGVAPEKDIKPEEIVRRRQLVFDLEGDSCRIPFPQFRINSRDYKHDETYFDVKAGTAEEWILTNPSAGTHPFHIHVNPFQVKETFSALTVNDKLVPPTRRSIVAKRIEAMSHIDRPNMWRDSVIIPPKGMLRVWMRFDPRWVGKTVFHCHFLAHEETGMMQNFRIVP